MSKFGKLKKQIEKHGEKFMPPNMFVGDLVCGFCRDGQNVRQLSYRAGWLCMTVRNTTRRVFVCPVCLDRHYRQPEEKNEEHAHEQRRAFFRSIGQMLLAISEAQDYRMFFEEPRMILGYRELQKGEKIEPLQIPLDR